MLAQDRRLLTSAVRYLPEGLPSAADSAFPLSALCQKCDDTLDILRRQQQQQGEGSGRQEADQAGEQLQQEVTERSAFFLQHATEPPQHSGQTQHLPGDTPEQKVDMVDCAVAAGELVRLALQALDVHPEAGKCAGHFLSYCIVPG
jgi:hypothetical protein